MQKVVTINLNGNAYQLEETGYEQLRAYLGAPPSALEGQPGSRGDHRGSRAGDRRQVPRVARPAQDRGERGGGREDHPRDGPGGIAPNEKPAGATAGEGAAASSSPSSGPAQPRKRLFNIREGEMWAGVCNGIAAYINVDVTWVRIAFALLTIFSWGGMVLVYIALAFIVPTPTPPRIAPPRSACLSTPKS